MKSAVTGHPAKLWDFYQHAHAKATPLDLSGMTGPLLLTAGTDDAVWDSVGMSTNLEKLPASTTLRCSALNIQQPVTPADTPSASQGCPRQQ